MSCEDNPNPPQCGKSSRRSDIEYYPRRDPDDWNLPGIFVVQHFVSCVNFYNQSDDKLLWWQYLRHETTFPPKNFKLYRNNDNECKNHNLFHFYLHNRSDNTTEKYDVEWASGARLRKNSKQNPDVINLCYTDHPTPQPKNIQRMVGYSFYICLLYYGKLNDVVFSYSAKAH